mgnify:CR=1 FL=1
MPRSIVVLALASLLAIAACKSKGKGMEAPETLVPISESEADAFAKKLETALGQCDQGALATMIDVDSMVRTAIIKSAVPANQQQALEFDEAGLAEIRQRFCKKPDGQKSPTYLRWQERDHQQVLLFRFDLLGGLNYLEFRVGRNSQSKIKVDEAQIYSQQRRMTEILRDAFDDLMKTPGSAALAKIQASDLEPAALLQKIESMEPALRDSKIAQIAAVEAAASLDGAQYQKAIDNYRALFPTDRSLDMNIITGYGEQKNFSAALQTVDQLDRSLGGDPYLDRARIMLLLDEGKDLARATTLAETTVQASPADKEAHYLLLEVHVEARNFPGAVAIMRLMGERFELVFDEEGIDKSDAGYRALLESPEWQAYSLRVE